MTALVYYAEDEQLCVAMDTRTLDLDDETGDRALGPFCSKMFLVPHLRGMITGTGIRSLPFHWHAFVEQSTVARNIEDLDDAASRTLPEMARRCGVDDTLTATVYHFGYSQTTNGFVARAFRSTEGFRTERLLVPSFGIKPPEGIELKAALGLCERDGIEGGMIAVMKMQKAIDDAQPPNARLGIGGEIQFLVMTPDEFSMRTIHRFDD